jgi:hypothetical protein
MEKLALLRLLGSACFVFVGVYYLRNAQRISNAFVENTLKSPRWLQQFFPAKWYRSRSFIWMTRSGGAVALLIGIALFGLLLFGPYHETSHAL